MPTPTPTNTTSSIGGSTGTTSISGTFSFSGGLPLTSGEWEIVVFLAADLPGGTVTPLPSADVLTGLTPRQLEVLGLLCQGHANREIGLALGMHEKTVKAHVGAIFKLLGVVNRTQAIEAARSAGFDG